MKAGRFYRRDLARLSEEGHISAAEQESSLPLAISLLWP
jgi:hypothetical protein